MVYEYTVNVFELRFHYQSCILPLRIQNEIICFNYSTHHDEIKYFRHEIALWEKP